MALATIGFIGSARVHERLLKEYAVSSIRHRRADESVTIARVYSDTESQLRIVIKISSWKTTHVLTIIKME